MAFGYGQVLPGVVYTFDSGLKVHRHELRDTILLQQEFMHDPTLDFMQLSQEDSNAGMSSNAGTSGRGETKFATEGARTTFSFPFWRAMISRTEGYFRNSVVEGSYSNAEDFVGNLYRMMQGGRGKLAERTRVRQIRILERESTENVRYRYTRQSQQVLFLSAFANAMMSPNIPWNEKLDNIYGPTFYSAKPSSRDGIRASLLTMVVLPFFSPFPFLSALHGEVILLSLILVGGLWLVRMSGVKWINASPWLRYGLYSAGASPTHAHGAMALAPGF